MSDIKIRMIFIGTSSYAKEILEALIREQFNVVAVFTRPDAPRGRKQEVIKSPVKVVAEASGIPLFQPAKLDPETVEQIRQLKPDIIIVAAYGKLLPKAILEIPGFGCLNVHASLLPKYRGPSPIQNVLLYGENETGVTMIVMNEGFDTGDIIAKDKIAIDLEDNAETLTQKLAKVGAELTVKTIPLWVERKIEPEKQEDNMATVCQLIEREDGKIVWEEEAEKIYNKYRALYPWPGIYSFWENNEAMERIKLIKISLEKNDPQVQHQPGEVFEIGEKIGVQTLKGVILIEEIQMEGKNPISIRDFLNGYPKFIGSFLR
jgi:methionyl-tRNA formyltransferase